MKVWFGLLGFVKWCLVPRVLPHGSDVLANDWFKIRGWDETELHVGSECRLYRHACYHGCRHSPEASRGECRSLML